MGQPISLGHITNADIYLDDQRMVGRVKEFNVGEMAYKMVTHEALGMIGVIDLPSRAMDSLKATINFEYYEPELIAALYNPTKTCRFFLHAYLDKFDTDGLSSTSGRLVTMVKTYPSKQGERGHKLGENSEQSFEVTIAAMTQKLSTQNVPLFEYDLFAGIHKVNGKDVWPN
ncbi:phage major tail tube protein [Candidatus Tokpelaia sp.]|uniref:phage major tail tube protein n=1 Tax=Candidatus Tokpelaia sp. TaxID=2233777 RepID=UPI00123BDAD9|nr:phage major tail tube protein [Candidatus Tokpelaia sp.]KAA6404491.1 hypothetical protein DPQ22_09675 [Candidatus Tokpelaia sp.]